MTPYEFYLNESLKIDEDLVNERITETEAQKKLHLLKINLFFPKIAKILEDDLEEQARIDKEFGYMGGNYE